jgi:hypothetical protein
LLTAPSFFHTQLFRRDIPTLCREMHFAPDSEKDEDTRDSSVGMKSSGGARSILQVPSLGSVVGTENHGGSRLPEGRSQQPDASLMGYRSVPGFGGRPNPMSWMQDGRQHQQHHQQQQHPQQQQQHHQQHQHQQQEAAFWMAAQAGAAMRQHPGPHGNMPVPPPPSSYAPVGIRSGRGAARLPAPRRTEASSSAAASASSPVPTSTTSRPSYPVSNRGKGSRNNASRRVTPPSQASEVVASTTVSGAQVQVQPITGLIGGGIVNTLVAVDKGGVKVVQQPPSILKRKFTFADSSKPAVPVSVITEEKKDDDDDDNSGSCIA